MDRLKNNTREESICQSLLGYEKAGIELLNFFFFFLKTTRVHVQSKAEDRKESVSKHLIFCLLGEYFGPSC